MIAFILLLLQLTNMSDSPVLLADAVTSSLSPYDRSPRRAFAQLSDDARAAWHLRYCAQEGAEPRVWALLARVEASLRAEGRPTTIHNLWMTLVNRAGQENNPDLAAAAALSGIALGLHMT